MTRASTAWAIFQGLLIEALPFLLLGVAIAGIARRLVPQSPRARQRLASARKLAQRASARARH